MFMFCYVPALVCLCCYVYDSICLCLLCYVLLCICFVMFAFHHDLVCYIYVLLCLCFVMCMFRCAVFGYVYGLLCLLCYVYVVVCICFVMCMFCLCTELWKHFLHLVGKGIKNMLYANILEKKQVPCKININTNITIISISLWFTIIYIIIDFHDDGWRNI